jgi:hypothetical protein
MKFYNNIFASTYKFYAHFKREAPFGSAICVLFVCQMTLLFLLLIIFGKITGRSFFFHNKYFYLPIFFLWLYGLYKYYSKERAQIFLNEFNKKTLKERRYWAVTALTSFLLPLILIFVVLIVF